MKMKSGAGFAFLIRVIVEAIDVSELDKVSVPTMPLDPASSEKRFWKPLQTSRL
jgi:hypothetical protein